MSLEDDVDALLRQGKKIEAIKLLREATGMGLLEAKNQIEGVGPSIDASPTDFTDENLTAVIRSNKKIQAIKMVREATGMDLVDAKAYVEQTQDEMIAAGEISASAKSGCAIALFASVGIGMLLTLMR